jgi:hypothetical protein
MNPSDNPKIIVVLGVSRAGKDTVASIIQNHIPIKLIKFSATMKRMMEYAYCLPDGALEQDCYRNTVVPHLHQQGTTYLDLMVKSFTHMREIDPYIMFPRTEYEINKALKDGFSVCLTDIRSPQEVDLILGLAKNFELDLLYVNRPGIEPLESDKHLSENYLTLSGEAQRTIQFNNTGDITHLESQVLHYLEVYLGVKTNE